MDISDDEYDPTTESQKNKTTTIKNKNMIDLGFESEGEEYNAERPMVIKKNRKLIY